MRPSVSVNVNSPSAPRAQSQSRGLRRNQDLGSELLRLHERAAGERLAGDAGRKAEVVLDARARARLSAKRPAIEHDDAQAFRGGVDGGGQARRSGTDDNDVIEFFARSDVEHAQTAPEGFFGRVEQHGVVGADDQDLACRGAVLLEQRRPGIVVLGVDDVMGIAVSLQKRLQAQHFGRLRRADQHGSGGAGFD